MGLPQGSRGSPTCTWVTLRPRPADGEAARSKWEKPGPQLPERWEGMKTQGHAAKEQLLGPPSLSEPESEAQESARLGGSRGILTLVGTELWVPATWISARSDAGGACVQYWCFSWASLSHIQPLHAQPFPSQVKTHGALTTTFTISFRSFLSPNSTSTSFLPFVYINCFLQNGICFLLPGFSPTLCTG